MGNWWDSLSATEQAYWFVSVPSTIILVIQLILLLYQKINSKSNASNLLKRELWVVNKEDGEKRVGFQILNLRSIIGFFTIFGWMGVILSYRGNEIVTTIILGIVTGISGILLISYAYYKTS